MKNSNEKLRRMVGDTVQNVSVRVQFYGEESCGEILDVAIYFTEDNTLIFGCAGDGSVLIARPAANINNPPNITTKMRKILGLEGELQNVANYPASLGLDIGGRCLLLTNFDDQIEVSVDGEQLPRVTYLCR